MSDTAIMNAVRERSRIEAKISESEARTKRLKAQLAEINTFISQWEKFSGQPVVSAHPEDVSHSGTDSGATSQKFGNSKKEEVAAAAREIIESRDVPISRSELFTALSARGLRMHGSNPEMVLSTMLWRAGPTEGIVRLKSGGYWLEGRPLGEDTSEQTDTNSDPPDTESTDMLE